MRYVALLFTKHMAYVLIFLIFKFQFGDLYVLLTGLFKMNPFISSNSLGLHLVTVLTFSSQIVLLLSLTSH